MRLYTLVVAALALGALGCRRGDEDIAVDTSTAAFDTGVSMAGASTDSRDSAPLAEPVAPTADGKALGAFIAASRHEIQHGSLATQKGSSQEVRDLGRSVSRDHDDFVQRAQELGKRLSIAPATQAADTSIQGHPDAMGELRARSGVDFDRAFLEHEVSYHRWLIDAVNGTMLQAATNEELRTFLQQSIPAFEAHMKGAQDLLAKLSKT
jgi:putative membrane protein